MQKINLLSFCFLACVQVASSQWLPGITVAGGNGSGAAANQLFNPEAVFVDGAGNIYIADYNNNRIQKWAPGASSGVTVAGGNGYGSAANQLAEPFGVFVDAKGNVYVADAANSRVQRFLSAKGGIISCPPNMVFTAPSCNGKATIKWAEPRDSFPATIKAPVQLDAGQGTFNFMGELNGHGYYISNNDYLWPAARDLAKYIGNTSVNGHLVTVNSSAENAFLFNKIKNSGSSPWIGLYNTGKPGKFRWVTDEPLTYTNWAPNEPNNFGGNKNNVVEPYVRFSDVYNNWNDQRDDYLQFIAEFEKPLIRYKQISGPKNGSAHQVGEYTVCYERTNTISNQKDTCCFNVTIGCKTQVSNESSNSSFTIKSSGENLIKDLHVVTSPNPSSTYFRLNITNSNSQEHVRLRISDLTGRIVESKDKLEPNKTLYIGKDLSPGIYFLQVTQGTRNVVVKIIKQ